MIDLKRSAAEHFLEADRQRILRRYEQLGEREALRAEMGYPDIEGRRQNLLDSIGREVASGQLAKHCYRSHTALSQNRRLTARRRAIDEAKFLISLRKQAIGCAEDEDEIDRSAGFDSSDYVGLNRHEPPASDNHVNRTWEQFGHLNMRLCSTVIVLRDPSTASRARRHFHRAAPFVIGGAVLTLLAVESPLQWDQFLPPALMVEGPRRAWSRARRKDEFIERFRIAWRDEFDDCLEAVSLVRGMNSYESGERTIDRDPSECRILELLTRD